MLVPGRGFAAMGPQRVPDRATDHPEELLALDVLKAHQRGGLGRARLHAVRGDVPFTAWVLAGNRRAEGFYRRMGATEWDRRSETIDGRQVTEGLMRFPSPPDVP